MIMILERGFLFYYYSFHSLNQARTDNLSNQWVGKLDHNVDWQWNIFDLHLSAEDHLVPFERTSSINDALPQ